MDPGDALLYTPTHENRLRVIGRQLDLDGYSAINLSETAGGCIVRALRKDDLTPVVLEFPDRDFPLLVREAIAARGSGEQEHRAHALLPTGYEDFLRAVGHDLDAQAATAVTVVDLGERIAVGGLVPVGAEDVIRQEPFSGVLHREEVAAPLDAAFGRRSRGARG